MGGFEDFKSTSLIYKHQLFWVSFYLQTKDESLIFLFDKDNFDEDYDDYLTDYGDYIVDDWTDDLSDETA